jgi:hypothetical protein
MATSPVVPEVSVRVRVFFKFYHRNAEHAVGSFKVKYKL